METLCLELKAVQDESRASGSQGVNAVLVGPVHALRSVENANGGHSLSFKQGYNMCMQCNTKAITIKNNILPGWHLAKARTSCNGWEKGSYALLRCNDPDFIFKTKPRLRPKMGKDISKDWWDWHDESDVFSEEIKGCVEACYDLYCSAIKAGYKGQDKHGFFAYWFRNNMAKKLKRR